MDFKNVFDVARINGEYYEKYEELMEQTDNEELKETLKEVIGILSDNRSKLLGLGKYMDLNTSLDKEAINIVAYGALQTHTNLTVIYEYDNGHVLAFDPLWKEHYLPKKLLKYS